ncbi:MAG: CAP domain-containing protein [Burkholderiaceae bacterium]
MHIGSSSSDTRVVRFRRSLRALIGAACLLPTLGAAQSTHVGGDAALLVASVDDPVAERRIVERAAALINNIRRKLDACGEDGMLSMRSPSTQSLKVSAGDIAARPLLRYNPTLTRAAAVHSLSMAREQFFDHVDPRGQTVGHRARQVGYRWRVVGENLAAGHESIDEAVRGWLLSTGHCRNLIDARFTEFGIARVESLNPMDPYGSYWTLVLGQPRSNQFASR